MKEIPEDLTPEQEAALDRYYEMAVKIGLSTETEFDKEVVEDLIQKHRKVCDVAPAERFVYFDSPHAAMKAYPELTPGWALYGAHDIHWLMTYMFYRIELGRIEETNEIVHLAELCKHVGWMWFGEKTVIVTKKPKALHWLNKASGIPVLHRIGGPAIEYLDGECVYVVDDITIPADLEHLAQNPDPKKILKCKNAEIRAALLRSLDPETLLSSLAPKVLDEDIIEGGKQELLEITIDGQRRLYQRMTCPSKATVHVEAVPPDTKSAKEGYMWRIYGQLGLSFIPASIYT